MYYFIQNQIYLLFGTKVPVHFLFLFSIAYQRKAQCYRQISTICRFSTGFRKEKRNQKKKKKRLAVLLVTSGALSSRQLLSATRFTQTSLTQQSFTKCTLDNQVTNSSLRGLQPVAIHTLIMSTYWIASSLTFLAITYCNNYFISTSEKFNSVRK